MAELKSELSQKLTQLKWSDLEHPMLIHFSQVIDQLWYRFFNSVRRFAVRGEETFAGHSMWPTIRMPSSSRREPPGVEPSDINDVAARIRGRRLDRGNLRYGVLTVTWPKTEAEKGCRISVDDDRGLGQLRRPRSR